MAHENQANIVYIFDLIAYEKQEQNKKSSVRRSKPIKCLIFYSNKLCGTVATINMKKIHRIMNGNMYTQKKKNFSRTSHQKSTAIFQLFIFGVCFPYYFFAGSMYRTRDWCVWIDVHARAQFTSILAVGCLVGPFLAVCAKHTHTHQIKWCTLVYWGQRKRTHQNTHEKILNQITSKKSSYL